MRILIAGGGQVAELIARRLIREGNEVTLVDSDNSPGRWTYLRALDVDGRGQPLTMDFASIDQPCHLARHLRIEFPGARGSRRRHGLHGGCYGHQTSLAKSY